MIQPNSGFIHFEGNNRELNSKQLQLLQEMYLVEAKLVENPEHERRFAMQQFPSVREHIAQKLM